MCIAEGVRSLATLEFKHDAFEAGKTYLQRAIQRMRIGRQEWYEGIQRLNHLSLEVFQDSEKYDDFEKEFDNVRSKSSSCRKKDAVAIRFGLIDQVVMLVLQASNEDTRAKALEKLLDLARESLSEGRTDDLVIFHALLDALLMVYPCVKQKDSVEAVFKDMESHHAPALKDAFSDWLEGKSIDEKMKSSMCREGEEESGRIFRTVKESVATEPQEDAVEYDEELRALYESDDFAQ